MFRRFIISFFVILSGCATQGGPQMVTVNPPDGVPICSTTLEFPGYRGGRIEINGIVYGSMGAFHANDMLYMTLGPMAEEKMVVYSVDIENIGSKHIVVNRGSFIIRGDASAIISPIPPDKILGMSRGKNYSSESVILDQLGEGVVKKEFSEPIDIKPGEKGTMMVAFPLPLPPNPKIIVTISSSSVVIPICWGK